MITIELLCYWTKWTKLTRLPPPPSRTSCYLSPLLSFSRLHNYRYRSLGGSAPWQMQTVRYFTEDRVRFADLHTVFFLLHVPTSHSIWLARAAGWLLITLAMHAFLPIVSQPQINPSWMCLQARQAAYMLNWIQDMKCRYLVHLSQRYNLAIRLDW